MKKHMLDRFEDLVSWYTIIVHDCELDEPYNDWTEAHGRQGFAWRPGTVSFGTLDITSSQIDVWIAAKADMQADSVRAICVPFIVGKSGVKVVSTNSRRVYVPAGSYSLVFQHGRESSGTDLWTVLTFVPDEDPVPDVLIAGSELSPSYPLVMSAQPV